MASPYLHPRLRVLFEVMDLLTIAAETGARRAQVMMRPRRERVGYARRPGADSPMWNVFSTELRDALRPHGAKTRLARYLGIPKQRLYDFLTGRSRLPDAELTLRMLHWLTEERAGRSPAL